MAPLTSTEKCILKIQDADGYQTTAQKMQSTLNSVFDKTMDFINQVNSGSLKKDMTTKSFPVPKPARKLTGVEWTLQIPALNAVLASPFGPYVMVCLSFYYWIQS